MIRKISTIILAIAIVITGTIAFIKLGYWDRSVRIFQLNSNQQNFREGRVGFDGRERRERPGGENRNFEFRERRNLPDSLRNKIGNEKEMIALPDSLRQQMKRDDFRGDRGAYRGNQGSEHRGGDFRGRSNISLGKASGFLAVFALFTLITIGIDKGFKRFRNRKNHI